MSFPVKEPIMSAGAPVSAPFDDIRMLVDTMPEANAEAVEAVRARQAELTKPVGSLGRLEEIVEWLAAWQGKPRPAVDKPRVVVFAGNHGVAARGVSPYPAEVTMQMVSNFSRNGAAINQICAAYDIGLRVYELALENPTPDIVEADAFDERGCAATIAYGMEAIDGEVDLLCLGEMGIANTTIAAAICVALYGGDTADWVGPGTGLDPHGVAVKADVVAAAVRRVGDDREDPLKVLMRLGGRELAAIVGAIIAARHAHIPVIVDGYVVTAAAAVLHALDPASVDHCLFGHVSAEPGHIRVLERMGKAPLVDLGMRLGEGTGAAIAAGIVKAAATTFNGMATFAEAGVSTKGE